MNLGSGLALGGGAIGSVLGGYLGGKKVQSATDDAYDEYLRALNTYSSQTRDISNKQDKNAQALRTQRAGVMDSYLQGPMSGAGAAQSLRAGGEARTAALHAAAEPAWASAQPQQTGRFRDAGSSVAYLRALAQHQRGVGQRAMQPLAFQGAQQGYQTEATAYEHGLRRQLACQGSQLSRDQMSAQLDTAAAYEPFAQAQAWLPINMSRAQHAGDTAAFLGGLTGALGTGAGMAML